MATREQADDTIVIRDLLSLYDPEFFKREFERIGEQRGARRGERRGQRNFVLLQLRHKLGRLPRGVATAVRRLPDRQLIALGEDMLDFTTSEQLVEWLAHGRRDAEVRPADLDEDDDLEED